MWIVWESEICIIASITRTAVRPALIMHKSAEMDKPERRVFAGLCIDHQNMQRLFMQDMHAAHASRAAQAHMVARRAGAAYADAAIVAEGVFPP